MWKSVLSEKVSAWLPASSHSHELDSLELLPFLNSEHATLEALNALRSGAKHRGVNAKNAEDDYPQNRRGGLSSINRRCRSTTSKTD